MSYVLANFINTSLAAAAASGSTSITLASSVGLPVLVAGQIMPLVLNDVATGQVFEIVYVTAITGAVCTVTRACENTTAQNWNIGDYAICAPTAATLTPALISTYVSVDVSASSDTTLTNTQYSAELINMTGVATTNQNAIVPSVASKWIVANNTTGAFTRTLKTAAGTGIVVPPGTAMVLYCDGVNVLDAESAKVSQDQLGVSKNMALGGFFASGDFTAPANTTSSTVFKITLVGGGGGGGGTNGAPAIGGGGGAGGVAVFYTSGLVALTAYSVTIGSSGTAGANTGGTGGTGGTTSIVIGGTTYSVDGGVGGIGSTGATEARVAAQGGASASVLALPSYFPQQVMMVSVSTNTVNSACPGGSAYLGQGGLPGQTGVGAGLPGSGYGAGGGGALGVTASGGAGTAGAFLIEYVL